MPTVAITAASSGQNTVVAATANKKIQVVGGCIIASGTVNAKFRTGATTDITGLLYLVANSGFTLPPVQTTRPWFQTAVGEALTVNLSAATAIGGFLIYELG